MDNVSFKTVFSLSGLNETITYRPTLFCLTLLFYCMNLLVNAVLVVTIVLDKNLHEPMYIFVCNICINGLCGTAGFYPKFLSDLLSPVHVISYNGCLFQAFVINSFACTDLSVLAVMAYDRYVAICRPLVYHSVMTKQRLSQLVFFTWLSPFSVVSTNILLTSTLRLCSSTIDRLYCVNWVIVKLACHSTNTIPSNIVAYFGILFYVGHGLLIVWSYIYLIRTCVRSKEDMNRFTQTCLPHLISLFTLVFAIVFDAMYMRFGSKDAPQSFRNFIAMEYFLLPSVINPLVYGFKLTKIRKRIFNLVC